MEWMYSFHIFCFINDLRRLVFCQSSYVLGINVYERKFVIYSIKLSKILYWKLFQHYTKGVNYGKHKMALKMLLILVYLNLRFFSY